MSVAGSQLVRLWPNYILRCFGRLDAWAERQGLRAAGQYGFRKGKGTADCCFVLNHVMEACDHHRQAVYAVFVDSRKAYDSVDREVLWECLKRLGVHGHMLRTLQEMYAMVRLRVRGGGRLGEEFESKRGVKQGDPLSPLLFGLLK